MKRLVYPREAVTTITRALRVCACLSVMGLVGCGSSLGVLGGSRVGPPSGSSATTPDEGASLYALACLAVEPEPAIPTTPVREAPIVSAGPMSDGAAKAKRLFDAERFDEASVALERVVDGTTGDDEGNKQIAEYLTAIALLRTDRSREAADVFLRIAQNPNHLKRNETLLWAAKLLASPTTSELALAIVARYAEDDLMRFDGSPDETRRVAHARLSLGLGRVAYRNRDFPRASALFASLATAPEPYRSASQHCLEMVKFRQH